MAKFNKDNNFGLPFDLPDYQDIEAILDEMVEKENSFRVKYNEEKIRIDKIRRERQALNSSGVPKNSETYITSDAGIRSKEQALTEEYRQLRQKANPAQPVLKPKIKPKLQQAAPKQVQQPEYAPKPHPQAPNYSVNVGESNPVVRETEYKPVKNPFINSPLSGWLVASGGIALLAWGGFSIISSHSKEQVNIQEVQVAQVESYPESWRINGLNRKINEVLHDVAFNETEISKGNQNAKFRLSDSIIELKKYQHELIILQNSESESELSIKEVEILCKSINSKIRTLQLERLSFDRRRDKIEIEKAEKRIYEIKIKVNELSNKGNHLINKYNIKTNSENDMSTYYDYMNPGFSSQEINKIDKQIEKERDIRIKEEIKKLSK